MADAHDEDDGVLKPNSVSSLAFDGVHIAVGTHRGQAKTWKQPAENTDYVQLLVPLQVDKEQPLTTMFLSGGVLCCFSITKQTFVTWKLEDGKLLHAWSAEKVAGSLPLTHASMVENLVASVHQDVGSGKLPSVQVVRTIPPQPNPNTCYRQQ